MDFKIGDTAYIIENVRNIKEVKIIRISDGIYTIRFLSENPSAIRVKRHRLFQTEEEAKLSIQNSVPAPVKGKVLHEVPLH